MNDDDSRRKYIVVSVLLKTLSKMEYNDKLSLLGSILCGIVSGEMLLRFLRAYKEYKGFSSHYEPEDRVMEIIRRAFGFNYGSAAFIILAAALAAIGSILWEYLLITPPIYIMLRLIGFNSCELDYSDWIRKSKGLDYAEGMAHSYFHGYLRLVISAKERTEDSLHERMKKYSAQQGVDFGRECLFILIPDDMYCQPVIKSQILERASPLESVVLDRAGVSRPYKNDVYRFLEAINGKKYYIAVEGATPIQTFYEALENTFTSSPIMKKMKRELLFKFYATLKKLVTECPEMRNLIEVVLYHAPKNNENGDIGLILKQHIVDYREKRARNY